MGPRITALGEIDFMRAQIREARQMIPLPGHILKNETIRTTAKKERIVPANGKRILCRKLPMIISMEAQILPMVAALNHLSDMNFSFCGPKVSFILNGLMIEGRLDPHASIKM